MKFQNLALLLIALVAVQSIGLREWDNEVIETITHRNQQKFAYPRSAQSCSKPYISTGRGVEGFVYGGTWDGQVCQPCAHPYCQCNQQGYKTCDNCLHGYEHTKGSYLDTEYGSGYRDSCQKCPNLKTSLYLHETLGANIHNEALFSLEYPEVKKCNVFMQKDKDSQFSTRREGYEDKNYKIWRKGYRATRCGDNRVDQGIIFQHYGSICWYMLGCAKYTLYGKCEECMAGYYLDSNAVCQPCVSTCATSVDSEYDFNCPSRQYQGCKQCSAHSQCSICKDGYWLASLVPFTYMRIDKKIQRNADLEDTVLDDPSWCVPCPTGAKRCSVMTKNIENATKVTDVIQIDECIDGYYKDIVTATCKKCPADVESCQSCKQVLDVGFQCEDCPVQSKNGRFNYDRVVNNQCYECPDFCRSCEMSENKTFCKADHCFNGYRPKYDDARRIEACIPCTAPGVRCETENSEEQTEIITQCQTGVTASASPDYDDNVTMNGSIPIPRINYYPPNSADYHLVDGKCLINKNLCKVMKNDSTCKDCYTDRGYYLETTTNICKRCTATFCLKCSGDGKCSQCNNGLELLNGTCTACPSTCKTCSRNSDNTDLICASCAPGYIIYNEGTDQAQCRPCNVQNCADCSAGIDTCASCKERFVLWDEQKDNNSVENQNIVCETCEYGCLKCDSRKICTECAPPMFLLGGVCHKEHDNCLYFEGHKEGSHKCTLCRHGYRITPDGRCMRCFSPELGATHCRTDGDGTEDWFSTVNGWTRLLEDDEETETEEEQQQ